MNSGIPSRVSYVDFHLLVEAIIHDQTVSHSYPMRLHGMSSYIGIIAHIRVVEISDFVLEVVSIGGIKGGKACHFVNGYAFFFQVGSFVVCTIKASCEGCSPERMR